MMEMDLRNGLILEYVARATTQETQIKSNLSSFFTKRIFDYLFAIQWWPCIVVYERDLLNTFSKQQLKFRFPSNLVVAHTIYNHAV